MCVILDTNTFGKFKNSDDEDMDSGVEMVR